MNRRNNKQIFCLLLSFALLPGLLGWVSGCAGPNKTAGADQAKKTTSTQADQEARKKALEERIIGSPMLVTSDYFRETAGEGKPLRLFGEQDAKKNKELEQRLSRIEERLKGLPERARDSQGLPVLRRKVVMLSLLGDMGLDVLSLLPAALRRTDGLVPVDASQLARLLQSKGLSVSDLASSSVRREIAADVGIQAYLLVYFPQGSPTVTGTPSALRIDVIHATESVLIGSYMATPEQFSTVAPEISEDVVRGTEWSCRVVKTEGGDVYLNAGRLTGLQPGDRLKVYGRGQELIDPITHRSLGFAPGELKGEVEITNLFGTDAAEARVVSGTGFAVEDVVKMAELG